MSKHEIIKQLEDIESSLNNNDIDEAKIDLALLLKELLTYREYKGGILAKPGTYVIDGC